MIRTKTTLIVGAGASQEIHLPSGPELLERTAQAYDFYRFGGDQMTKDSTQLLRHLAKLAERPGHSQDKLYEATERLRISARMSSLVDTAIEQNDDNPLVTTVGKLAIAHFICQGEARSNLRPAPKNPGELPLQAGDFWLLELGKLMTAGVPRSKVHQCFENLSIISFNYDRSIEHFLPYALITAYGMTLQEAQRTVSQHLRIVHPYGTIGRLPWQSGEGADVDWGNETPWNMTNLVNQIRTAGELMKDQRALSEVRNAMLKSQRIVFMGFGYHPQNLDVLIDSTFSHNPEVLAGIHGLPGASQSTVVRMLRRKLGLDKDDRLMVINARCFDLFKDYAMLLES
jgi:hypothetical protein